VPRRLALVCSAHPWRTIAGWIVAAVVAIACAGAFMDLNSQGRLTGNPESFRAERLAVSSGLYDRHPVDEIVVIRSDTLRASDPAFRAFLTKLRADGRRAGVGAHPAGRPQVSQDGHAVAIPLTLVGDVEPLTHTVKRADRDSRFRVTVAGDEVVNADFDSLSQHDLEHGELAFGLPMALVILLFVFGAVATALVPLGMAIVSIVIAIGMTAVISQFANLSIFVVNMISGMGLALGIDYSLFVVSRYREERARGNATPDAIELAGKTASRAVLFSGSAFVIALTGMLLIPHTVMRSLALGAILVGIVSVAAALTLLPALLGILGDRVNAWRLPYLGRMIVESAGTEGRLWARIVRWVMSHPAPTLVAGVVLLLAAATPVFALQTGQAGVSTLPDRLESKQGYLALQRDFRASGTNPVYAVVRGSGADALAVARRLRAAIARDPAFGPPLLRSRGDVQVLRFAVAGDATGKRAADDVRRLRSDLAPAAVDGRDAQVLVGGDTAEEVDYEQTMHDWIAPVFAFVLGLTFVLLTVAFRSVVIALKAIVLNLLSVGAAYGLLVLVFQKDVLAGPLGLQHIDRIEPWVPLFLFSVLFALSMDYHVFLLSRIRERYLDSRDNRDAVAYGVGSTARLITGAAAIIVAVFIGFASGDLVAFQEMGFGVAVSLALDATLIRSVILPASMTLLGDWNWWLPRWLGWIPRVPIEGTVRPSFERSH
jgi:RND superfamily putative drug exporter